MTMFVAITANAEVNGETVYSVVAGMGSFKTRAQEVLTKNGIENPKPGRWYSQQAWLNAFKEISTSIGPNTLYCIGLKIPENAKFPPHIETIEDALQAIDVAYHMNHRINGNVLFDAQTGTGSGTICLRKPGHGKRKSPASTPIHAISTGASSKAWPSASSPPTPCSSR
jgi:hypothetical protein